MLLRGPDWWEAANRETKDVVSLSGYYLLEHMTTLPQIIIISTSEVGGRRK
jgi:hypothetical protein